MKPHPRIRKTIKWGGAAATVLLVVVWFASVLHPCCPRTPWSGCSVGACNGQLTLFRVSPTRGDYSRIASDVHALFLSTASWSSSPAFTDSTVPYEIFWQARIPIWLLAAPVSFLASIALGLDTLARRRSRLNLCPKCDYDRAGIAGDAKCPECGAMPKVG